MTFFNKERMVVSVFKFMLVVIAIGIILLWVLGGGFNKIYDTARSFHFTSFADLLSASSTNSFAHFRLPWQIDMPQIPVVGVSDMAGGTGAPPASSHATFANASAYAGQVTISEASARTQSASGEYIELDAAASNGTPLDISGWSLESALSGARAYIPQAAAPFLQGRINPVGDVALAPGGHAIISTGASPVGVSFQENSCIGYLGTLQPFVPALPQSCPSPLLSVPNTPANDATLGSSCFDYLATLPPCTFPAQPPSSVSAACLSTIQNTLSYNGCVAQHQNDPGFSRAAWRLYLAHGSPLWQGQHDVIRLLDAQGHVVDVLQY